MNAWVQAIIWRHEQKTLAADPVAACAEELMYVYNNLEHSSYTSIDDVVDGTSLRNRAQYILDWALRAYGATAKSLNIPTLAPAPHSIRPMTSRDHHR